MRYLVRYAVGLGVGISCRGTVWYSLLLEWSRLKRKCGHSRNGGGGGGGDVGRVGGIDDD